jgi:trehalose 6-phosphate phosphatase
VFVDFDGTLAAIVEAPDQARPRPGAAALLARLAARYARVAVISGRPVAYLAEHLGDAGATELIGLYGLERTTVEGSEFEVEPDAAAWRVVIDTVASEAEAAAPEGLTVERKGLAVTFHFRQAPHLANWAADFAAARAAASGLAAHPGKMSWELRPPGPTDKGTVIAGLATGLTAVCFVGDDRGDLPAFATLGRLRAEGIDTLTVAVGGPETPAELLAGADLVVDGPAGVLVLLETLAGSGELPAPQPQPQPGPQPQQSPPA